ncbi:MAG TPA: hypothetical protein VF992_04970 [Thermoplasmata archaeon]
MTREFLRIETDTVTVDWDGNPVKLHGVPALKDTRTGKIWFDPAEVVKAELRQLAESCGVSPRQLPVMLLLQAQPGPFPGGSGHNKYKLNKMLFYQWKELEKQGLGEAYEHDRFEPAIKGPIPRELYSDLADLESKGLAKLKGGKSQKKTLEVYLTSEGLKVAKSLWEAVPLPYREVTIGVKTELFPLDPHTIMERVHADYPEYKKIFVEPDEE